MTEITPTGVFWHWLREGWRYRARSNKRMLDHKYKQEYVERVKYEASLIESKDYISYFLMLSEAMRWCKDSGIPVGPARGSAAASLVCYLLRITEIDPMPFPNMLFERFIDINRSDLPDVDLDVDDERREELTIHMTELYGEDHVAKVGTYTKYRGKNALDDVARVFGIPKWEVQPVKDLMIERSGGDSRIDASLEDTFKMFPQAAEVLAKHPDLNKAIRLEGNYRSMSVHAAGLVISNDPLVDNVAYYTQFDKDDQVKNRVMSVDKKDAEYLGLLKADFLGLKTMGMIRRALEMIGMPLEDLYTIPLDEPDIIDMFHRNDVVGIFQFSGGATRIVNGDVKPDNFLELCDINSLSRPGPLHSGTTAEYIKIKHGKMKPDHLHPVIDEITKWTQYSIIYQEQILQILKEIGGLPWTHLNQIRKIISQKEGVAAFDKVGRLEFIQGAWDRYQIKEDKAAYIFNRMVTAGQYAFCMTGDTVLTKGGANQHSQVQTTTLGELYALQQSHTRSWWDYHSPKVQQMSDDGRVRPEKIDRIYDPVVQPILRVTTRSGRVMRMSTTHRLLSDVGYVLAHQLVPGMNLVAMGDRREVARPGARSFKGWDGMLGEGNPSWIDGRTSALRDAKGQVLERSKDCCEFCEATGNGLPHVMEFAHILTLDDVGGDYSKYHSATNIMRLCNSCHKEFDYRKGQRVPRDTHGRLTVLDEVVSIEPDGEDHVYDVHMASTNHNYIGDGIVQHNNNAHCVSYSMLAYWQGFLKVRHPSAFYAANLIKFEKDEYNLLRDALSHGIKILGPDLDESTTTWTAGADGIRGGFQQITGIGPTTGPIIIADREKNGPFANWADLQRIKGIGPKTADRIKEVAQSDDPYGIHRIDNVLARVRRAIETGELGILPRPTHTGSEIPTDADKLPVVYVGIPYKRNPQDVIEDERARTGDEYDVIIKRMKDPHLSKKMVITCMDDSNTHVYIRFYRQDFPKFEKAAWSIDLEHDVIIVQGMKRKGFGTGIHVKRLWVVDPDQLEEEE